MNRFSTNGDGKSRAPTNRTSGDQKTAQPATPQDEREQQIIAALASRYEQLDALWQTAEEDLKQFRLHTVVATRPFRTIPLCEDVTGASEYHRLGFLRLGKGWRICYGVDADAPNGQTEETRWTPISDCSVDLRIEAMPVFEELRQKVVETAEQSVPKLDTALANFRRILKG
jgi:hypothetical protein